MSLPNAPALQEAENLHLDPRVPGGPAHSPTPTLVDNKSSPAADAEDKPPQFARSPTVATIEEVRLAEKPKGLAFGLIILGLYLAVFLTCLDVSIVAPAIPRISNDFGDISKATWFFSIYLAINTAFQPPFGAYFKLAPKYTFLACLLLFALGSLMCGVAPSSNVFIGGRAVAGLGSAGLYIGTLAILATITEPHETARWANGVGGIYSLGAVAGPLIGGAFVTSVTWRWCFYINLPVCGITFVACFFFLKQAPRKNFWGDFRIVVRETDWLGLVLVIAALVELLMVFQWGGLKYNWGNSVIIGLLCGFFLTVAFLCGWIVYRGERGYLRPRILKQRIIWTGALQNYAIAGAYFTSISVLAYYFQIRGSSAIRSGVQLLPLIAGVITSLVVGGAFVPKVGYVNPFLGTGMVLFTVATGLYVLLDAHSSTAMWAGITFFAGFASGLAFMMPYIAVQASMPDEDKEQGCTHVLFPQTLGGAITFAIGQSIFQNKFYNSVLQVEGLPNAVEVAQGGVTAFLTLAPAEFIPQLTDLSIKALRNAYYAPIAILGLATIVVFPLTPWVNVAPPKAEPAEDASETTKREHVEEKQA